MKNYKNIIASSLAIAIVLASPAISFAKENGNGREKGEKKEEVERSEKKTSNWFSSSWFGNKSSKNAIAAPVISNVIATSTKGNKATIKWNTDVKANSFLWYGTTSQVNTTVAPLMKRGDRVLKHKFELKKLQPNTTYYVVVGSANNVNKTISSEISFTTGSYTSNQSIPVITNVIGPATIKVGDTATFTINAYDPNSKALTYGVDWGDGNTAPQTSFTNTVTITHTYNIVGTYVAKFTVVNTDGKKATYPMKVTVAPLATPDTKAPVISSFVIPATATTLSVNITSFTVKDEVGVTGYKITETATAPLAGDTGWTTTKPTTYTFSSGGAKTLYAWAKDAAGNISTSLHDSVIITLSDTTAPVISAISTNVIGTTATITWTTNEPSNSSVFYSTTASVDTNSSATPKVTDTTMVTNHSVSISGLTSSTLYHFIIKSADASNNIAVSSEATFTTN